MSKRSLVTAVLLVGIVPALVWAAAERQGPATAKFNGVGPAGFKVQGTTDQVEIKDTGKTVTVIVPVGTLKTGVGLRDRHLREKYVQTDKYPNAELELPWSAIELPADGARSSGKGTGKMTLHGVTKEVPFTYTIQRTGTRYEVTGDVPIKLTDFGITIPNYMGVTLKPDITTHVTFGASRP